MRFFAISYPKRGRAKAARTIADLAGEPGIRPVHMSGAIQYRMMDG